MSVVGTAIVLGVLVAVMVKLKVARPSAVIVCVLFGLVLGATPIRITPAGPEQPPTNGSERSRQG